MNNLSLHLQIIGCLLLLLSVVHIGFPRKFKWKLELSNLTLVNRQLMYVHTFFVAVVVLLNGLLFIFCANELTEQTRLARFINIGLLIFWLLRWIFQHFVYSPKLWRGKRFETFTHVLFTIFWTYIVVVLMFILIRP
jgi:hypothetical protein